MRQGKRFAVMGEIDVGYFPSVYTLHGASFGYFALPDSIVSVRAQLGYSYEHYHDYKFESTPVQLALIYQQLLGPVFQISGGLYYRSQENRHIGSGSHYKQQASMSGGVIAIGQRWQFKHFAIGVDYLQANSVWNKSLKGADSDGVGDEDRTMLDKRAEERLSTSISSRLSMGASF